jgi:hypothetical protein
MYLFLVFAHLMLQQLWVSTHSHTKLIEMFERNFISSND